MRRVGLDLRLDRRLGAGQVGVVDLQVRQRRRRTCRLGTGAALLEADVAGLLDDTERVLHTGLVQLLTGGLAGERLALADVGDGAEVLPLVDARS